MRIYEPYPDVLTALGGSGITVAVGTRNEDLPSLASDANAAIAWVQNNIVAYKESVNFGWIIVGNEVIPSQYSGCVSSAMANVWNALNSFGLSTVKVSTAIHGATLGVSYPPSAGAFSEETNGVMTTILTWLSSTNNPLFVNVHPYWAFASDPTKIPLDYAMFRPAQPVVDGDLTYNSLFEAMVDAIYSAMEKSGGSGVGLIVGESGWPTSGNDPYTNVDNAKEYNQNLINLVKIKGTPKKPNDILDTFIFAMFNEDLKPAGVEQNWGLHYPDMTPIYPLTF
ncbi:glucan endo-1,3-beta-glucosidase-like [Silene latifolia]|uniref:glucan endo-1,3-beta-glucosidase-like n=1 Tax=Silene latifolia TaxID=37657 RepID=UPI003D76ADD8